MKIGTMVHSLERLDKVMAHVDDEKLLALKRMHEIDATEHVLAQIHSSQLLRAILLASC